MPGTSPACVLCLLAPRQVLQWARGNIRFGVLHIHGLYTDPCGMVLDPSGYKDVTQDPEVMVRPPRRGPGCAPGAVWGPLATGGLSRVQGSRPSAP